METISLYVHVPFCMQKCLYCDFCSFAGQQKQYAAYTNALCAEIKRRSAEAAGKELCTLFIGGGTPTLLPVECLQQIMDTVFQNYRVMENAEITIEANPGTLHKNLLTALRQMGINRLSIGLQAWQDRLLWALGRIHRLEEFLENFHAAKEAGFENISVDLMFALPGQSIADWQETLQKVVNLKPSHISAYSLIVEEGTPFYEAYEKGKLLVADEETDRQMYDMAKAMFEAAGYQQYEISNFARPGFESRHNMAYWQTLPYIGCGLAAHSYIEGVRFHNTYDLEKYISENGNCQPEDSETLTVREQEAEFLFCGLRMIEGVSVEEFYKRFGRPLHQVYGDVIKKYISQGLMAEGNNRLFLTSRGLDVSNQIFVEFLQED